MTFNRCETGERMYFSFPAICKDDEHPCSFGEHTFVYQLCELYLFLEECNELYLSCESFISIYVLSYFSWYALFKEDNLATISIFPSCGLVFLINQHLFTFTVMVNNGMLLYSLYELNTAEFIRIVK